MAKIQMGDRAVLGSSNRHCLHFLHSPLSSWLAVKAMPATIAMTELQNSSDRHSAETSSHSIRGNESVRGHFPFDEIRTFVPVWINFVVESVLKRKAKALFELSEILFNQPLTVVVRGLRDALCVVPNALLDVTV